MNPASKDLPPIIRLDEALLILREMDQALLYHLQWLKNLHRTLLCGDAPRLEVTAEDAHRQCNFGLWFYRLDAEQLIREPGIAELEEPHRIMHDAARTLLGTYTEDVCLPPDIYETFMNLALDFKQRMRQYQFQLVQRVCSVDQLTGVWNRNSMAMQLAGEAERARRGHHTSSICLLDLDKFKQINDRYGHVAGDRVLHEVARFIKDNLRAYDSMFRYGGEEFLICLPNTHVEDAGRLLNRLREQLAGTPVALVDHTEIRVTASFGVAALEPEDEIALAVEHADHALLCAKSKGRNRVCIWNISGKPLTLPNLHH